VVDVVVLERGAVDSVLSDVRLNICIYRFLLGFFYVIQREIIHENVMVYDIQRTDKAYLYI
jgi:hypothetical protein